MPALVATDHVGTITWLGRVLHRDAQPIVGEAVADLPLTFAGMAGEFHAGLTRPACSRVRTQYPRDTVIRNVRQLSVLAAEELEAIAAELGLDTVDPAWLGASVVIAGIPDFTHIPPSSRLQGEGGCTLTVDMLNQPCQFPAMSIELARPGHGKRFKPAAEGRRGVTAWVEREGTLRLGEKVQLHVPAQRAWQPNRA